MYNKGLKEVKKKKDYGMLLSKETKKMIGIKKKKMMTL